MENKIQCFKNIDNICYKLNLPHHIRRKAKCLCGGIFNYHRYIIDEKYISPTVVYISSKYYKHFISLAEISKVCEINYKKLLECFIKIRREFTFNRIIISPELLLTYLSIIWSLPLEVQYNALEIIKKNPLNIYDAYLLCGVAIWSSQKIKRIKLKTISDLIHFPSNKISKLTKNIRNVSN